MDGRGTLKKNTSTSNDKQKRPSKKKKKARRTQETLITGYTSLRDVGPSSGKAESKILGETRQHLEIVGERNEHQVICSVSDGTGGTESDGSFSRNRKHKSPTKGAQNASKSSSAGKTLRVPEKCAKNKTRTKSVLKQSTSSTELHHNGSSVVSVEDVRVGELPAEDVRATSGQTIHIPTSNSLPDMFNESLRWEFMLPEERAEEERIQRYKFNRRKRYLANTQNNTGLNMACTLPTITCTPARTKSQERTAHAQEVMQNGFITPSKSANTQQLVSV